MTCVYAVTTSAARVAAGTRGLAGERLRAIPLGHVAAIVGDLRRRPQPSVASLRRYDAVMTRLASQVPAILPARFGTTFDSFDELAFVLRSRERTLRASLANVRGRVQMTVRVILESRADARASEPTSPSLSSPEPPSPEPRVPSGTRYLHARAAARSRERAVPGFAPVRAAVARWIRDEHVDRRGEVASVYHLVPRGAAAAYERAVNGAAAAAGLRAIVTGPWPPYAFASW